MSMESTWDSMDVETDEAAKAASFVDELWEIARAADPSLTEDRFIKNVIQAMDQVDQQETAVKVDTTHPAFKAFFIEALHAGCVSVTFRKVTDNSERTMLCTKNGEIISEDLKSNVSGGLAPAEDNFKVVETAVRVYDLEKHAWRSFRWSSITNYCLVE